MSINTTRHRVPIAPYEHALGRPIRMVLADFSDTVTVIFKDGSTTRTPKAEEHDA